MSAVKKNDRIGWGIFYADENQCKEDEQLLICFLTINRNVVYLRVLYQPPGGLYPVVIVPPNGKDIKTWLYKNLAYTILYSLLSISNKIGYNGC